MIKLKAEDVAKMFGFSTAYFRKYLIQNGLKMDNASWPKILQLYNERRIEGACFLCHEE